MANYSRQSRRYPKAARRARNQARQEAAPAQRQGQRDIARAQRQGQSAASSARKTYSRQAAYERSLAQNLPKGIATPGLVSKQLMAGAQQSAKYGGAMAKLATRGARQDVRSIQESLPDVQSMAAENLAAMVVEKRQAAKAREEDAAEQKEALSAAKRELRFNISRIPVKDLGVLHLQPARDDLAKKLASTEGIDLTPEQARELVERMYRKLRPTLPSKTIWDPAQQIGIGE